MAWGCQSHCNILLQKKGEKILFLQLGGLYPCKIDKIRVYLYL